MQIPLYAILALCSALSSASATVFIRQGLRASDAYTALWLNVVVGTVGLWIAVFCIAPSAVFDFRAIPFFVLSGLLGTVVGRLARFVAIDKVGAPVGAAINNLSPFISTALAILLLGERVTLSILLGTAVIVCGTVLLSLSGKVLGFRLRHLTYPFLSAACFGVVAIVRKLGLSQTGPLFGAAVNTTTAMIAFSAFLLASGQRQVMRCKGPSLPYFIAAGAAENAAVFLNIVALSLGEVSVVVPLSGTAPLFVLLLTVAFLQGVERLTWRIVAGSVCIVLGVGLLTA